MAKKKTGAHNKHLGKRRPHGRQSLFTAIRRKTIIKAFRAGMTTKLAAGSARIAPDTLRDWLRDDRPQFVAFQDEVNQAQADLAEECLAAIKVESPKDWRAAAWMLERIFHQEYQRNAQVEVKIERQTVQEAAAICEQLRRDPEALDGIYKELISELSEAASNARSLGSLQLEREVGSSSPPAADRPSHNGNGRAKS